MTAALYFGELIGAPQYSAVNPSTVVLDGAGDYVGGVFIAPKTGTIDRIQCYCTAVSSPVSTNARLEGVSAGVPSGSLIAANTSGSFTPAAATLHTITLTAAYSVTRGELVAVVLNAPTAGASNTQTFNARSAPTIEGGVTNHFPRAVQDLSVGSYSQLSLVPSCVPMYSDGSYFPGCTPNYATTINNFSNTSTPDERGNRWTQVGNLRCIGAVFYSRGVAAGCNFNVKLYPTTADNAAPSGTFAGTASTFFFSTAVTGTAVVYFADVDLVDGTDYRLTVQPSSANNIAFGVQVSATADMRQALSQFYATSRTRTADGDDGTWTDDTASFYPIWPLFSQNNAAAGGGGLFAHRGMVGGMTG